MDSISPLAKILAEANGIDWRSLHGSGPGDSVVEQDILNYLSRIMSGDEEPPATPVDEAPPGWTGEMPPMPVAISGLEALSAAGVESDITDFVAQQSQAAQPLTAQTLPNQPTLSELAPAQSAATSPAPEFGSITAVPARRSAPGDDLEFELDDLDDEPAADDLPAAGSGPDAAEVGAEVLGQPVHSEAVQVEAVQLETVQLETVQLEPVQLQQPAYDPVALDTDADFVMADRLPGLPTTSVAPEAALPPLMTQHAGDSQFAEQGQSAENIQSVENSQPAQSSQPAENNQAAERGQPEYGRPAGKEQATVPTEAATRAGSAGGFGLGGFLSRLYGGKAKAEAEAEVEVDAGAVAETNMQAASAAPSSAESAVPLAASGLDAPALYEPNLGEALIPQTPPIPDTPVAAPLVADQWRDQELTGSGLPALGLSETPHTELGQPTDLPEAHESMDHGANQETSGETQPTDQQAMSAEGPEAAAPRPAPEAPTPEVSFSEQLPEASSSGRPETGQPTDRPPSWTDLALPLGVVAGVGAGLAAAGVGATAPDAPQSASAKTPVAVTAISAPASHTAMTLRLNLDLHALETARAQLSTALMRDVPLGLLVARAAARSLSTLGLHIGGGAAEGVALADHAGQPLATDLRAEFRASLEGLGHVAQAQPALLVLDASALGLDELHRGECSLSVGRAAADGAGAGAVLSLRGDLDPARGAQFLHEVAGLLGTPILLLF